MKIAIAGKSGFIGANLSRFFESKGYEVWAIERTRTSEKSILWDTSSFEIEIDKLENFDVLINLVGESLSKGLRWTPSKKNSYYTSRINSTKLLTQSIQKLERKPKIFVSASAVGFYGNSVREADESSESGDDFLARLCSDWEKASQIPNKGVRVINTRFGIVMDKSGGYLKQMLSLRKIGFGVRLGNGRNHISWISLTDLCRAIEFVIENEALKGPVNLCTPSSIESRVIESEIAKYTKRPNLFRIPKFIVSLIFGKEKSEVFVFADQVVKPEKLLEAGFSFKNTNLADLLPHK